MYVLPSGTSTGYDPVNPKWGASSGLIPCASPCGLGYFRPNQAIDRRVYGSRMTGLGQGILSNLPLLAVGGLAAYFLLPMLLRSRIFHPIRASSDYSASRAGESRHRKSRSRSRARRRRR